MRNRSSRNTSPADVDLTPMLDVTFILLIFFLVTSTVVNERAIGLEPPAPSGSPTVRPTRIVQILLDESQLISVEGRLTDIGGVRPALEALSAELPDLGVAILAHPAAKSGVIVQVRDAIYEAGIVGTVGIALTGED